VPFVKIIADYREKSSGLIDLLENSAVDLQIQKISCGDYLVNDFLTIERKTARDFLVSIIDGRLFRQIGNLKRLSPNPILLIEGNPFKTSLDFDPAAIRGALLSIQVVWRIPVIHSRSTEDSLAALLMIGRQLDLHSDVVSLRGGYRPKRLKSRQLYILQGLPGVGPVIAKRLLKRFGTLSAALNAGVEELCQVEGIGTASGKKIRHILESKFSS
jgi:DNA excision repair protein ERCC-4